MKNIFLTLLFFCTAHSFAFSQGVKSKKHYRTLYFYSVGLQPFWGGGEKCISKNQKEFGFGYKVKKATLKPLKLLHIKRHNQRVEKKMVRRFGADWKDQYQKAVRKCN